MEWACSVGDVDCKCDRIAFFSERSEGRSISCNLPLRRIVLYEEFLPLHLMNREAVAVIALHQS